MNTSKPSVFERSTLTFCIEGLSAREELLFKAFVRLLNPVTHQNWVYQIPDANLRIDLLVVADGHQPTHCKNPGQQAQPVLRLGSAQEDGHGYLSWPLKPSALEQELNRLGGLMAQPQGAAPGPDSIAGTATHIAAVTADITVGLMRLQKWPPGQLLAGVGRMRLATLLTGKAMSLDELVHRSALPLQVCKAFVVDLQKAQLLQSVDVRPATTSSQPTTSTSIFRAAPSAMPNAALPTPVQPGLLDRIRMRLGIKGVNSR